MPDPLGTIADAPSGVVPELIGDSRFSTNDIRLSAALCALGFTLKVEAQPILVTLDADRDRRVIKFFHEGISILGGSLKLEARFVDLWWNSPSGKYTIVGYDDALTAMRRVGVERAQMINVAKHSPGYKPTKNMAVATTSLHTASILAACEIKLIGYDPSGRQWIFAKGAEVISDLIKKGGKPKEQRPLSNDLCIDWMIEWIRYRDWLAKLVKDPECIPMIEMRDGERSAMISRDMNEKDRNHMIARL
jgi:hypothetical protein